MIGLITSRRDPHSPIRVRLGSNSAIWALSIASFLGGLTSVAAIRLIHERGRSGAWDSSTQAALLVVTTALVLNAFVLLLAVARWSVEAVGTG